MLSKKELNAKIAGIRKSMAAIRENIHVVLCNAAGHAYEHGDVTAFTRLFDALSGANRKQVAKWVNEYGFAMLENDGTFRFNKAAKQKADFVDGAAVVEYLLDNAMPWYADEPSAADIVKELDVAARIKSLASQIKNAANKNTTVKIEDTALAQAMGELRDALRLQHISGNRGASTAATDAAQITVDSRTLEEPARAA
jgi:hypothetical protein